MSERPDRLARNEAMFRSVNERVAEVEGEQCVTRSRRRDHVEHSVPELVLLVQAEPVPFLEEMLGNIEPDRAHGRSISGHARAP